VSKSEQIHESAVQVVELEKLLLVKNLEIADGAQLLRERQEVIDALQDQVADMESAAEIRAKETEELRAKVEELSSESRVAVVEEEVQTARKGMWDTPGVCYAAAVKPAASFISDLSEVREKLSEKLTQMDAQDAELQSIRTQLEITRSELEEVTGERNSSQEQHERVTKGAFYKIIIALICRHSSNYFNFRTVRVRKGVRYRN
jgi:uncharacterized protein (DUF3084 family)